MTNKTITLITGANRGMGLELAKELGAAGQTVIIGSRNLSNGQSAAQALAAQGADADAVQLDITDTQSIEQAVTAITDKYGYLSILINNAGASFDKFQAPSELDMDAMHQEFDLNFFGTVNVTQHFIPLLQKSPQAKIINISTGLASMADALDPQSLAYNFSSMGYQASKAALNMFTIQLAKEFQKNQLPITVNAVDPGWIATEFGGTSAESSRANGAQPVEAGVARTVALATASDNNVTATFSNTQGTVNW